MKSILFGAVIAASIASVVPAAAQRIDIGPGGPSIDLRSRAQRERDFRREEYRRDEYRRARDDRGYFRNERYEDRGGRRLRRDYGY